MARRVPRSPGGPLRIVTLLIAVASVVVLSLSDRTIPLLRRAIAHTLSLVHRALDLFHLDPALPGRPSAGPPVDWDTFGHFAAWAVIGLIAGFRSGGPLRRMWWWTGLFTLSAAVEVGQQRLSHSRMAELADLYANGVGLAVGMVAGAAVYGLGSTAIHLLRTTRRPATP